MQISTPHTTHRPSPILLSVLAEPSFLKAGLVSAAVFVLPLSAYLLTIAPTIYNLDSAELTTAATTGGLMRATGYPLYLLLGRFWSQIPIGDAGYRMNLFSAVSGALGVWLTFHILRKLRVGRLLAAGAAGLMAAAPFYWSLSLVAEVYTLQVVLTAGLILLLLHWAAAPGALRLGLAAGWFGLSMGHHLATGLLAPAAAFFVIAHAGRSAFHGRSLAAAALGVLIGSAIYLYLPFLYLQQPAFNYAGVFDAGLHFHPVDLASPGGLWWLVTGRSFASQMFAYQGAALGAETVWFAGHLGRAFAYVGIGPGLLGLAVLFRKDWRLAGLLGGMFLATAFFYIDYRVVDKETMFLPTYLVWAIWLGLGYQALLDRIRPGDPTWLRGAATAAIAGFVVAAALSTGPAVDLSSDTSTRVLGEEVLASVREDAVVFGWWDTVPPVQYLQLVEGRRPDVQAVNRFLISSEDLATFIQAEARYRPVYVDSVPEGLPDGLRAVAVGGLYRIEPVGSGERNDRQAQAR